MNATNELEGESNILQTDTAPTESFYMLLDGQYYPINLGGIEKSDQTAGCWVEGQHQQQVFLLDIKPEVGEIEELRTADVQPTIPEVIHLNVQSTESIKVEEQDFEAISRIKLGGLTPTPETESGVTLLNSICDRTTELSPGEIAIKLPTIESTTPEALVSLKVLTHTLGKLSKVGVSSRIEKFDLSESHIAQSEVVTYLAAEPSALVSEEDVPKTSWNTIILPRNTLLLRHPVLLYSPDRSFAERICLFPSQRKNHAHGLIAGTVTHSSDGLLIRNHNLGPIQNCFSQYNSEMNPQEGKEQKLDFGKGFQVQLIQLRQADLPNNALADPFRMVYAMHPNTKWLPTSTNTNINNIIVIQSGSNIGEQPNYALTPDTTAISLPQPDPIDLKRKPKTSRKSKSSTKPATKVPLKRSKKVKKESIVIAPDSEFSNGFTSIQESSVLYSASDQVIQSPVANNSSQFPQQYLFVSPSNLNVSQSSIQTGVANNYNHPMIVRNIQNTTQQMLPVDITFPSNQPNSPKDFSVVPADPNSHSNNKSATMLGTTASFGNIPKHMSIKVNVNSLSSNSQQVKQSTNSSNFMGNCSSPVPVIPNSCVRLPMFEKIQVNNIQHKVGRVHKGSTCGLSSPMSSVNSIRNPLPTGKGAGQIIPIPTLSTSSPNLEHNSITTPVTSESFINISSSGVITAIPPIPRNDPLVETKIIPDEPEPFTRERFIDGHEALCSHCGTRSRNLHFCEYCKTRISNDAKLVAVDPSSSNNNIEVVKRIPVVRKSKGGGKKAEECIVLSSDDEDQPKSKVFKSETKLDASSVSNSTSSASAASVSSGDQKEFKIHLSNSNATPQQRRAFQYQEDEMDVASLIEEIKESQKSASNELAVDVECRSIRVGDYKCSNAMTIGAPVFTVVFSQRGIMFTLPHARLNSKSVTCAVPIDTILIVEANFKKTLPVIFMATGPRLARSLRKSLGLSDDPKDVGYHYGPQDGDKCQKRIVFIISSIAESAAGIINKIFGRTLSEIDNGKANQILLDITRDSATTAESSNKLVIGTSKLPDPAAFVSTNIPITEEQENATSSTTTDLQDSSQVNCSENKTLLSYHGISVQQMDLLCLADEQFLNDSILDFWLRYIEHELLCPVDKDRTYMFSTFFYKRLTTKPKKRPNSAIEEDPSLSASEKRHSRVKRWTKNVDIFEKDFLIIPINESLHWFLAVICFPGLQGVHDIATGEPLANYNPKKKRAKPKLCDNSEQPSNGCADESGDCASALEKDVSNQDGSETSPSRKIKKPCIIVFDSLAVEPRGRVYSTLREYLKMEYKTRKGEDREFTKTSMPGCMPKVPQQPNHCDCGIYTLFYVECFFKYPITSFDMTTDDVKIWRNKSCATKREAIFKSIQVLVNKNNPEAKCWIPRLSFNPPVPSLTSTTKSINDQLTVVADMSVPIETTEKIVPINPVNVAVYSTQYSNANLKPSIVESARASPSDNDHDHDYAGIPPPK